MNNTKILVSMIVVIAIAIGGYVFPKGNTIVERVVGASAGPEHTERQSFLSGSSNGGRVATTTTAATYTTDARDFNGTPTYIDHLPNVNTTISLSSTSTFAYVPKVGDVATIYWRNASTTAASSITFAAVDANLDLQDNEDSANLALNGLDIMEITLIRESNNLVSALLNEYTEAD